MKKVVFATLLVVLSFIILVSFNDYIDIGGITPDLLIIVVVLWAFSNGTTDGLVIGFFAGLLLDCFFGYKNIIGLNALGYMFLGYICGVAHDFYYSNDIKLPLFLMGAGDFLCNFAYYILFFLLKNKLDFSYYNTHIIIPSLIYTLVVGLVLYKPVFMLCKWLNINAEDGDSKIEETVDEKGETESV